jgi:flavorubredoxin
MRVLKPNVFFVGAIDWDRRMFDELIPLPDGTSYNSYVVRGSEKTALIDTVDPAKSDTLIGNLVSLGLDRIDYIVANHAEQDHSGSLPELLVLYPQAKVVTNPKCRDMLVEHLHLDADQFLTVEDGGTLSLGDKTLKFLYTPWVHWPETMCSYLVEDRILFSCDFFGSHLATSSLFVDDEVRTVDDAKRYYAEIMMPFRSQIQKNLDKLAGTAIEMIAPSHGPVYPRPALIMDAYREWVGDRVKNEVVVAYVSMHDSTRRMVEHLVVDLMDRGLIVKQFNLVSADIGQLAISLVDAATVILASPTVLVGPHPAAAYAAVLVNALRPKTRFVGVIGSYGWAGKMVDQLKALLGNLKAEFLDPVLSKGLSRDEDYVKLDAMAGRIYDLHKQAGLFGS